MYEELYLSDDFLKRGEDFASALKFAMYSDEYIPGTNLPVKTVFQREVNSILHCNAYCGIWQVAALASVLRAPVYSVYPNKGSAGVRRDLNRVFFPREGGLNEDPVYIMWTTTREDMTTTWWTPNHFVVLLPREELSGISVNR